MVLGHELVHATHEHTRRGCKKQMWIQLAALGVAAATEKGDRGRQARRWSLRLALTHSGSRPGITATAAALEDQADRVGLRYAYEAGYDITRGPRLGSALPRNTGSPGSSPTSSSGPTRVTARAAKLEKRAGLSTTRTDRRRSRAHGLRPPCPRRPRAWPPLRRPAARMRARSRALTGTASESPGRSRHGAEGDQARHDHGGRCSACWALPAQQVAFGSQTKWVYPSLSVDLRGWESEGGPLLQPE